MLVGAIDNVNQQVLRQHVPLVRRILSSSEHPEVAVVGSLGEIKYLVDNEVTESDLQITEMLIQSESASSGREQVLNGLKHRLESLQPYRNHHLLRAGLTWALRHYEVTIDPQAESIVLQTGFIPPDLQLEEPTDASPADRARWIFEKHSGTNNGSGERVVELLLEGRDVGDLSSNELHLLAQGYNWCSHNKKAFEIAKIGLTREPLNCDWLSSARTYLNNSYLNDLPRLLTACNRCIVEGIGPAPYWHLLKASYFSQVAVGEFELEEYQWEPGGKIFHPEMLQLAAESMEAALACQPDLRDQEGTQGWVGNWNARFAAVLQDPKFQYLAK